MLIAPKDYGYCTVGVCNLYKAVIAIKPTYIERLSRTFREDVLDAYQFKKVEELRILCDEWQYAYNHYHPHKSLKRKTPAGTYNAWRHPHSEQMIEQQQQQQGPAIEQTIIHSL